MKTLDWWRLVSGAAVVVALGIVGWLGMMYPRVETPAMEQGVVTGSRAGGAISLPDVNVGALSAARIISAAGITGTIGTFTEAISITAPATHVESDNIVTVNLFDGTPVLSIDEHGIQSQNLGLGDTQGLNNGTEITVYDTTGFIYLDAPTAIEARFGPFLYMRYYEAAITNTVIAGWNAATFSNVGASTAITFALPTADRGRNYCFYTYAAQTIYVDPASGDQIHVLTNGAGDQVSNATPGDSLCLLAVDTTY